MPFAADTEAKSRTLTAYLGLVVDSKGFKICSVLTHGYVSGGAVAVHVRGLVSAALHEINWWNLFGLLMYWSKSDTSSYTYTELVALQVHLFIPES